VIREFPDYATALACYRSDEYQRARPLRLAHSACDFMKKPIPSSRKRGIQGDGKPDAGFFELLVDHRQGGMFVARWQHTRPMRERAIDHLTRDRVAFGHPSAAELPRHFAISLGVIDFTSRSA